MLRVETEAQGRFVSFTMDIWTHPALGLWAVPIGCASLPLGQQSCHICPFPSSQLSSSRPGHLRLLPHHSPSVFYAALRRRPNPLYPGLIRTGLRLTECPEAWSASVGVWAPEGEKALLNSREAGVGGVEASKTRQPWPIVTTGAMAIRSHGPAAQTKRSAQVPADPGCR